MESALPLVNVLPNQLIRVVEIVLGHSSSHERQRCRVFVDLFLDPLGM